MTHLGVRSAVLALHVLPPAAVLLPAVDLALQLVPLALAALALVGRALGLVLARPELGPQALDLALRGLALACALVAQQPRCVARLERGSRVGLGRPERRLGRLCALALGTQLCLRRVERALGRVEPVERRREFVPERFVVRFLAGRQRRRPFVAVVRHPQGRQRRKVEPERQRRRRERRRLRRVGRVAAGLGRRGRHGDGRDGRRRRELVARRRRRRRCERPRSGVGRCVAFRGALGPGCRRRGLFCLLGGDRRAHRRSRRNGRKRVVGVEDGLALAPRRREHGRPLGRVGRDDGERVTHLWRVPVTGDAWPPSRRCAGGRWASDSAGGLAYGLRRWAGRRGWERGRAGEGGQSAAARASSGVRDARPLAGRRLGSAPAASWCPRRAGSVPAACRLPARGLSAVCGDLPLACRVRPRGMAAAGYWCSSLAAAAGAGPAELLRDELLGDDEAALLLDLVAEPGPKARALVQDDGGDDEADKGHVGPDRRLGHKRRGGGGSAGRRLVVDEEARRVEEGHAAGERLRELGDGGGQVVDPGRWAAREGRLGGGEQAARGAARRGAELEEGPAAQEAKARRGERRPAREAARRSAAKNELASWC